MKTDGNSRAAYGQVVGAFKRVKAGATAADISARTGLPLNQVRELIPRAADEYRGRLEVTESGEILYSFPRGFTSRYRGFRPALGRFLRAAGRALGTAGAFLFKVWIMVMLVGYFCLFLLLVLAALLVSVSLSFYSSSREDGRSRHSGGAGAFFLAGRIIDLFIRLWFYSQLFDALDPYSRRPAWNAPAPRKAKVQGRPLHKAVFSFVFGDGDPNRDWPAREKKTFAALVQARKGVVALPEIMAITGLPPQEAEERATALCAAFGGMPEATEDGTVVYRFQELLLRADRQDRSFSEESAPLKPLKPFSSNPPKANRWFAAVNGVNLLFGSYFLYNALRTAPLSADAPASAATYLYHVTALLLGQVTADPRPLILAGLGAVPLAFSALFWLIPLVRKALETRANRRVRRENFRRLAYGRIWREPLEVKASSLCFPKVKGYVPPDESSAAEEAIKEMGTYAMPEVSISPGGETLYRFEELARERSALDACRAAVKSEALGATVFDSGA